MTGVDIIKCSSDILTSTVLSSHLPPPPSSLPATPASLPRSLFSNMASQTPAKEVYFSPIAEFPEGELPSRSNVIAYAKYILSKSEKKKKLQDSEIVSSVTEKVMETWTSANPCFSSLISSSKTICSTVKRLLEDSNDFVWGKRTKKWRDTFESKTSELFDILRCSCHINILKCSLLLCERTSFPPKLDECGPSGAGAHYQYNCLCKEKGNKIPRQMVQFIRYFFYN